MAKWGAECLPAFPEGKAGGPLLLKVREVSTRGVWSGWSGQQGQVVGREAVTSKHMAVTGWS